MNIAIVGIHTGIGKTICSAILCEALDADYWKPVQAGELENSDFITVRKLCTKQITIHPERHRLTIPASPHYAAAMEGVTIKKEDFELPQTSNHLIIETAGGLMSPLADNFLNIDLVEKLNCPVIVVSENYLGSINHTLLTLQLLKNRNINVLGVIFNGDKNPASEEFILSYSNVPFLFSAPKFQYLNSDSIAKFATSVSPTMKEFCERTHT